MSLPDFFYFFCVEAVLWGWGYRHRVRQGEAEGSLWVIDGTGCGMDVGHLKGESFEA